MNYFKKVKAPGVALFSLNFLRIMKLTIILVVLAVTQIFAKGYSQNIDLNVQDMPLEKVFALIEQQSGYVFFYDNQLVQGKRLSLKAENLSIREILQSSFKHLPLEFTIVKGKNIVVKQKAKPVAPIGLPVSASQQSVHGRIINTKGEPLEGVTVSIKGSAGGTTTDAAGNFVLSAPAGSTISISMIGYLTQEIQVQSANSLTITLEPDNQSLEEVVVTALGLERQGRSLTYSTQVVSSEELSETREPNPLLAVQGKVAGLSITESGTGVGAPVRIVLRGNRSISGDSQPIYIIDGMPGNPDILNPDNIASMNVLKGANAAALYGSAAQNGAIIIETKRGKAGESSVNFNSNLILTDPVILQRFQNQYGQGNGGNYNKRSEFSWGPKMEGQLVEHWSLAPEDAGAEYALSPQPNNVRDFYQTGLNFSNNISISHGTEKNQTFFNYTRTDASGIIYDDELKRNNLTLRWNTKLTDKVSLDSKIDYMFESYPNEVQTGSGFSPNYSVYLIPRNIRTDHMKNFEFRNGEGELFQNYWLPNAGISKNPHWLRQRVLSERSGDLIEALLAANYQIADGINLLARGNYIKGQSNWDQKLYNDTYNQAPNGRFTTTRSGSTSYRGEFIFSYNKEFLTNWTSSINFGGSVAKAQSESLSSNTGPALTVPNFFTLSNSTTILSNESIAESANSSLFSFINLSWKNAVFIDITGRNDWSSTLPADNRSYFYPSVGLSAVVSDLITLPDPISFLRLRGAWAQVGNAAMPYMLSRQASLVPGGTNGFLQLNNILPNPDLKPEMTESMEGGLNVQFWEGRLGFDFTMYNTNTRNQLFTVNLPIGSGASQYYSNGGEIRNHGYELVMTANPVRKANFNWSIDLNYGRNISEVITISDDRPRVEVGQIVIEEGEPWGNIYARGFERDGQGRVLVTENGLPMLTPNQSEKVANFNPDWLASVSQRFSFKGINLRVLIDHRQGGTMLSFTNSLLHGYGVAEATLMGREGGLVFGENLFPGEQAVLQDGSPNNVAINAEQFWNHVGGISLFVGEAFVESATNTRLRELSIGYEIPRKLLEKGPIKRLDISLVGRNLFYLYRASKTVDADLRVGTGPGTEGIDQYVRPSQRTVGINLSVGF